MWRETWKLGQLFRMRPLEMTSGLSIQGFRFSAMCNLFE